MLYTPPSLGGGQRGGGSGLAKSLKSKPARRAAIHKSEGPRDKTFDIFGCLQGLHVRPCEVEDTCGMWKYMVRQLVDQRSVAAKILSDTEYLNLI